MIRMNAIEDRELAEVISKSIEEFYTSLIGNLDKLDLKKVLKRKNPYLFRAKSMQSASEIVSNLLSAHVSSSEETIFGNVFFEPIATYACGGQKALAEGIDVMMETTDAIYSIAVK